MSTKVAIYQVFVNAARWRRWRKCCDRWTQDEGNSERRENEAVKIKNLFPMIQSKSNGAVKKDGLHQASGEVWCNPEFKRWTTLWEIIRYMVYIICNITCVWMETGPVLLKYAYSCQRMHVNYNKVTIILFFTGGSPVALSLRLATFCSVT